MVHVARRPSPCLSPSRGGSRRGGRRLRTVLRGSVAVLAGIASEALRRAQAPDRLRSRRWRSLSSSSDVPSRRATRRVRPVVPRQRCSNRREAERVLNGTRPPEHRPTRQEPCAHPYLGGCSDIERERLSFTAVLSKGTRCRRELASQAEVWRVVMRSSMYEKAPMLRRR